MAKKVEMVEFPSIETGTVDWKIIKKNFQDLFDTLNEKIRDVDALAVRQTVTISRAYEIEGRHVFLEAGKHPRFRVVDAYAIVHDNIDQEIRIDLPDLAAPVKFSATERKETAKIFTLFPNAALPFWSPLLVVLSATRRVSVYITFESTEVESHD